MTDLTTKLEQPNRKTVRYDKQTIFIWTVMLAVLGVITVGMLMGAPTVEENPYYYAPSQMVSQHMDNSFTVSN